MIGGYGRGRRHRRIYRATGIPGYGRGRRCWAFPELRPGRQAPYGPTAPALGPQDELKMLEEEELVLRQEIEALTVEMKTLKEKMDEKPARTR